MNKDKIDLDNKYVYIINKNLKMSRGKIAAQVSHVAMLLGKRHDKIGRSIILKADKDKLIELRKALNTSVFFIKDKGLNEVPENSLTCIGFKANSETEKLTKELNKL